MMNAKVLDAMMAKLAPIVHQTIVDALKPYEARMAAVEQRAPVAGPQGPAGASVTVDDVAPLVADLVSKAVSALPVPKDGAPGEPGMPGINGADGKSVTVDDVAPLVADLVSKAVSALPVPKDGEPGVPGRDGINGADGKSVTVDEVAPLVADLVSKAVAAIPVPKDGEPGLPGRDGINGADGKSVTVDEVAPLVADLVSKAVAAIPVPKDGEPGAPGKDGVGLAGAMIDREGKLIITLSDGSVCPLGAVVGKDGEPGAPGRDGLDYKDLNEFYEDDGRILVRQYARDGEVLKEFRHVTKQILDRGVWKAGDYRAGDSVTHGGHVWVARKDTSAQPDTSPDDWRMQMRKPRDGRDGKPGDRGGPGPKGDKGDPGPRGYGG